DRKVIDIAAVACDPEVSASQDRHKAYRRGVIAVADYRHRPEERDVGSGAGEGKGDGARRVEATAQMGDVFERRSAHSLGSRRGCRGDRRRRGRDNHRLVEEAAHYWKVVDVAAVARDPEVGAGEDRHKAYRRGVIAVADYRH